MNHKRWNLLAIPGSIRKNSTSEWILKAVARLYPEELTVRIYNQIDRLPYFDPDLVKTEADAPESVKAFYGMIKDADAVIICTPEYVFSLPGALKNALEWTASTTVFSYKPFAFIIAAASGEKAFESLDLVMKTLLQESIDDQCKLLIKGARGKINEKGEITGEELKVKIKRLVDELIRKISATGKQK